MDWSQVYPARSHKPYHAGSNPAPATFPGWASAQPWLIPTAGQVRPLNPELVLAEYANRQSGQVESLAILWVQLPPRSLPRAVSGRRKRQAGRRPIVVRRRLTAPAP